MKILVGLAPITSLTICLSTHPLAYSSHCSLVTVPQSSKAFLFFRAVCIYFFSLTRTHVRGFLLHILHQHNSNIMLSGKFSHSPFLTCNNLSTKLTLLYLFSLFYFSHIIYHCLIFYIIILYKNRYIKMKKKRYYLNLTGVG